MKKLLCLIIPVLFSSCGSLYQDIYNDIADSVYEARLSGQELYYIEGLPEFETLSDIGCFLNENITYKAEPDGQDYAQSPEETWALKTGDCEDFCLLFMNIAYLELGIKYDLVLVDNFNMSRSIEEGGEINHSMIRYNGVIYSAQTGSIYSGPVGFSYRFDDVF